MLQENAIIEINRQVAPGIYYLRLESPGIFSRSHPGQFIHINLGTTYDPLLRRPMSIFNAEEDRISVLYQVVGRGTEILSRFNPGASLDIIGPLGRGFEIKETSRHFLLGGGIGSAPLVYLAHQLHRENRKAIFFLGMRTEEFLFLKEFLPSDLEFYFSQENSPAGHPRLITDLLAPHLESLEKTALYCCGPEGMYREIGRLCSGKNHFSIQVSIDRRMGCGVGTCLGCAVKVKNPPREEPEIVRACVEGPVFPWGEVFANEF